jgi:hypothetical protein
LGKEVFMNCHHSRQSVEGEEEEGIPLLLGCDFEVEVLVSLQAKQESFVELLPLDK